MPRCARQGDHKVRIWRGWNFMEDQKRIHKEDFVIRRSKLTEKTEDDDGDNVGG
jgi:hypothetical protein